MNRFSAIGLGGIVVALCTGFPGFVISQDLDAVGPEPIGLTPAKPVKPPLARSISLASAKLMAIEHAIENQGLSLTMEPRLQASDDGETFVVIEVKHVTGSAMVLIVVSDDGKCRHFAGRWGGLPAGMEKAAVGKAFFPSEMGFLRKCGGRAMIAKAFAIQAGIVPTNTTIESEVVCDGWLFHFTPGKYLQEDAKLPVPAADKGPFMYHVDNQGKCAPVKVGVR